MPFVPGELAEELAGFTRFGEACLLCTTIEAELAADHRVVHADERVVVVAPFWSGSPFELLVLPRRARAPPHPGRPRDLAAVGRALRDVLVRLRRTVGDVGLQRRVPHRARTTTATPPTTGTSTWCRASRSVAGFEQGTGVLINIVAPELAAQQLAATD